MRYGIIRESPGLAEAKTQRLLLEHAGCCVVLEDHGPSKDFSARIEQLIGRLGPDDEILIEDLRVLPANCLPRLLLQIMRAGASLRIGMAPDAETLRPSQEGMRVLALLAPHGLPRPKETPSPASPRKRGRSALTRFQVQHARKLFRQGMSVREIGMVFRLSPEEIQPFLRPP